MSVGSPALTRETRTTRRHAAIALPVLKTVARRIRRCRRNQRGDDRQCDPVAISHEHHFAAFSNLGAPDSIAPFLDGKNEPSKKAAAHSILPARSSEANSVCQTESQIRLATIHQTGASTWSASRILLANLPTRCRFSERIKCRSNICGYQCAGRPRPFFGDGRNGSSACHCASVKSCRLIMPTILTQTL